MFQAATATGPLKYSIYLKATNICETTGKKKNFFFLCLNSIKLNLLSDSIFPFRGI